MPRIRADKYTLQAILATSRENCGLLNALVSPEPRYALMNYPFSLLSFVHCQWFTSHNTSVCFGPGTDSISVSTPTLWESSLG
jgi:hypothetical protein